MFAGDLDYKYNIQLDGVTTILEFHYNARADRWSMHVLDIENNAIRHGVRLVVGLDDLLSRVALDTKPPGNLKVVDSSGNDYEPTLETLGVQAKLKYVEEDDL